MFHHRFCVARKTALATSGFGCHLTPFAIAIHLMLAVGLLVMTDDQTVAYAQPPASAVNPTQPAQEAMRRYDIPAGSLSTVLARFASETGILLAATPELVENKESRGVRGTFSVQAALDTLLIGTGLEASKRVEGGFTLRPQTPVITGQTLPLMTVSTAHLKQGTA